MQDSLTVSLTVLPTSAGTVSLHLNPVCCNTVSHSSWPCLYHCNCHLPAGEQVVLQNLSCVFMSKKTCGGMRADRRTYEAV